MFQSLVKKLKPNHAWELFWPQIIPLKIWCTVVKFHLNATRGSGVIGIDEIWSIFLVLWSYLVFKFTKNCLEWFWGYSWYIKKICLKRKVLKLTCKTNLWKEIFKKFSIRIRLPVFSKSYWDFSRNSNQTHLGAWQRFIPQFRIYLLVLVM